GAVAFRLRSWLEHTESRVSQDVCHPFKRDGRSARSWTFVHTLLRLLGQNNEGRLRSEPPTVIWHQAASRGNRHVKTGDLAIECLGDSRRVLVFEPVAAVSRGVAAATGGSGASA